MNTLFRSFGMCKDGENNAHTYTITNDNGFQNPSGTLSFRDSNRFKRKHWLGDRQRVLIIIKQISS